MDKIELKTVEKEIKKQLKQIAKVYQFKSISSFFYKIDHGVIHRVLYDVRTSKDATVLRTWLSVKPYDYDDIFWEIFDMSENSEEKDSLRVNGAFTAPFFELITCDIEIKNIEECDKVSSTAFEFAANNFEAFQQEVNKVITKFDNLILSSHGYYQEKLLKILANIHLKQYRLALNIVLDELTANKRGGFRNNDKDIYEYVKEYCEEKLK